MLSRITYPCCMGARYGSDGLWRASTHHFTLFIHFSIGPVTELSAVFGENTSDMWLWSLKKPVAGQRPALQSAFFKPSSNVMIFGGSSSPQARNTAGFPFARPGRLD